MEKEIKEEAKSINEVDYLNELWKNVMKTATPNVNAAEYDFTTVGAIERW